MNGETARRDGFQGGFAIAGRDADQQRLDAALVDTARAIRAARDGTPAAGEALLARCDALLQYAREAAGAKRQLVAWDCLHQIERELAAAMDEPQRRAALATYRAEAAALGHSHEAIDALAGERDGGATVADLQALMRSVHAARERRYYGAELARRQVTVLTALLVAAVVFFTGWALAGGFEWILQEDIEVTLAMMLVNGVLFGFLGGLLSLVFGLLRGRAGGSGGVWAATLARPFVGAAVAIPIAFFLQSGLLNLGNVTPAFDLALCFVGGFSERWFARQFGRIAAGPPARRAD
jgi:hypothetical protein